MKILGINAHHPDVAVALLEDGVLALALEEERFARVKHIGGFPHSALAEVVRSTDAGIAGIDRFAVARRPTAHIPRKLLFAALKRPRRSLLNDRARNAWQLAGMPHSIALEVGGDESSVRRRLTYVEHHAAHLASAYFVSPFDHAAVCAIDGFGDFVSSSVAVGEGTRLRRLDSVYFPHSLGILYLAMTQYLGFPKFGDEYKVMGLAPYGRPDFTTQIRELVQLKEHGRFELDLTYFQHWSGRTDMTWGDQEPEIGTVFSPRLEHLLGPRRNPREPLQPRHEAIAASLQAVFEECAFHMLNDLHARTGLNRLCLAGGCAMNSVMNGKIRDRTPFEEIYIQPAAGDNGTALGAALYVQHQVLKRPRSWVMEHAYWGTSFTEAEISQVLDVNAAKLVGSRRRTTSDLDRLCGEIALKIADGKVVGWFQGRMEWGARALGNRSILADPRRPDMRDIINSKIKFRERFRPFAPSILEEALEDYFVGAVRDPFMIQVYPVRSDKRSVIPAVTHVDGSGRLQTVSRRSNEAYWTLIKAFEALTGVPVLLNTSFNENEPIVRTPEQALDCFLRTDMDVLVMGAQVLEKTRLDSPGSIEPASAGVDGTTPL